MSRARDFASSWECICLKKWWMSDNSHHLSNECDGLFPIACASPMFALITLLNGFLTPSFNSNSNAEALITSGPLTAYSIFFTHGFMFSTVTCESCSLLGAIFRNFVNSVLMCPL
eukprot:TRINITY_DN752_c0_g1_i6.p1 TRINITY_DN752_c0_g1~~TRINITY_DN752_c0_g1_i6.p1  ORF type:complete len:115 (-),score=8.73 TRINITY_DN752_c0_g1_i6:48-392(-)